MRHSVSGNDSIQEGEILQEIGGSDEEYQTEIIYDNSDLIPYLENITSVAILCLITLIGIGCVLAFIIGLKK